MALTAFAALWLGRGPEGPLLFALLAMAAPGLAGLTLLWRDGTRARAVVLAVWGLAALVAAGLSGGATGSLSGFVFAPLAAGLAFGTPRLALGGALATALAAAAGTASLALKVPPSDPLLGAASAMLTAGAAALALRGAWTRREQALAGARAAVTRAETVLAGQPGLTLVLEPTGRVAAAYGAPPSSLSVDALFDQGLISAVHAPDRPALMAAMARAMEHGEAQTRFAPRLALDRRVLVFLRRLEDPQGPRLDAQLFDGTAAWAREEAIETARAEAQARSDGKTRFLAGMSHELRTPLNAVIGFADIMRQRLFGPLPDRYAAYADSIHEAGNHLLSIINDVLDVSKIEADRYTLTPERFDAREAVSSAMGLVRVAADDKGVILTGVLPSDPLTVVADRRALKQIALNLLSNAVKFTPAGGAVTVTLEIVGPYLELVVADTGVGVAPEDLKRLGRPFEQAGDADQRAMGSGLGLALVRALAEQHRGRMGIDSTLGEGTAVTVRMPVAAPPQTEDAPPPQTSAEIIPLRGDAS